MTAIQEFCDAWHPEIRGWSSDILPWYALMAERLPASVRVVELGVAWGRSVLFLAEKLAQRGKDGMIYAVDPWPPTGWEFTEADFDRNWGRMPTEVRSLVCKIRGTSETTVEWFVDGALDLVFIDGLHDEASVRADIAAWYPKVKPGGVLAGHDYSGVTGGHPGVALAVDAMLQGVEVTGTVWSVRLS